MYVSVCVYVQEAVEEEEPKMSAEEMAQITMRHAEELQHLQEEYEYETYIPIACTHTHTYSEAPVFITRNTDKYLVEMLLWEACSCLPQL